MGKRVRVGNTQYQNYDKTGRLVSASTTTKHISKNNCSFTSNSTRKRAHNTVQGKTYITAHKGHRPKSVRSNSASSTSSSSRRTNNRVYKSKSVPFKESIINFFGYVFVLGFLGFIMGG